MADQFIVEASVAGPPCSKTSTNNVCRSCPDSGEPASKRKKVLDRLLGCDDEEVNEESVENEVRTYLSESAIRRSEDPLNWWKLNQPRFPRLSVLAKKYLCIPATSTASERAFSTAGIIVDKKRCSLSPEMVNIMVFLHKNSTLLSLASAADGPDRDFREPLFRIPEGYSDKDEPDLPDLHAAAAAAVVEL